MQWWRRAQLAWQLIFRATLHTKQETYSHDNHIPYRKNMVVSPMLQGCHNLVCRGSNNLVTSWYEAWNTFGFDTVTTQQQGCDRVVTTLLVVLQTTMWQHYWDCFIQAYYNLVTTLWITKYIKFGWYNDKSSTFGWFVWITNHPFLESEPTCNCCMLVNIGVSISMLHMQNSHVSGW